jgi:carbon monoxide dehydrogenase subunit G
MEVVRSIEIERPVDAVFAFVADPRNDPRWCPKVKSVEQVGDGRYAVVHKPVPGKPERQMEMTRVASDAPRRIEWREEDGVDVFEVTYSLEDLGERARLTQTSVASLGAPRLLHPIYRAGIGRDMAKQLKELKKLLEG